MSMPTNKADVARAAELRKLGNKYFEENNYAKAIQIYTEAMEHEPDSSILYSNRALCRLRLYNTDDAIADCKKAIALDSHNVKAHFFLGNCYTQYADLHNAVKAYAKAHTLSLENPQTKSFAGQIYNALYSTRKKIWLEQQQERKNSMARLKSYLANALDGHCARQIEAINQQTSLSSEEKEMQVSNFLTEHNMRVNELETFFAQEEERQKPKEVPDSMCCKITFDIMFDPVIGPSGITYERAAIEQHLQRNGPLDPVSRERLTKEQLIPNLALRDTIENYLNENPWAFPE